MYDINFFERHKPKPKKTNYFALVALLLIVILVAGIAYLEFSFINDKKAIQDEIDGYKEQVSSPEKKELLRAIDEKNSKSIELARVLDRLNIVDSFLKAKNAVYSGLIGEITMAVPENCFIMDISIGEDNIMISGYADGYESVAQFQHQLRSIDRLRVIFNPNISKEDANYSFSIAGKVKVEVADEN